VIRFAQEPATGFKLLKVLVTKSRKKVINKEILARLEQIFRDTCIQDEKSDVRSRAARALGKIGTESAATVLLQALNHKDSKVRAWAAWALAQIGTPAVVTRLRGALNHQASHVRIWATWALGEIGSPAAVARLIGALKHKDSQVRWRAASALGKIGGEAVVNDLLQALNDSDYYVQGKVASALGKLGTEAAVPRLLQALNNTEFYVRGTATEALKQIGTEAVVSGLLQVLNNKDSDVSRRGVWILGQIRSEAAVRGLLQALNNKDSSVRKKAASALWEIGSEEGRVELLQARTDKGFFFDQSSAIVVRKNATDMAGAELVQAYVGLDSSPHKKQLTPESNKLPTIFITSCAEASEHILCKIRGPLIKHLISIGSPGVDPPQGYSQVPHRLRLEFDDIDAPDDDPDYVLATSEDIRKVIDFVPLISQDGGNILIHCQAGISRSCAVALTVCAVLLGAGKEEEALAMVLAARPQAEPNRWIVELADEALGREGKLVEVVQQHHELLLAAYKSGEEDWDFL
jgi:HEAT repeat protein/predicted protein tyrosine phosphatase